MIRILEKRENNNFLMVRVDRNNNPIGEPFIGKIPTFKIKNPTVENIPKGKKMEFYNPETFDKRFELRITSLEKKIIDELREKGVNVSEVLRNELIKIDPEITKKITRDRINKTRNLYTIISQEYLKVLEERNKIVYLRGETQNEGQAVTDYRYTLDYVLDNWEKQINILGDFLKKFKEIYKDEWNAESTD